MRRAALALSLLALICPLIPVHSASRDAPAKQGLITASPDPFIESAFSWIIDSEYEVRWQPQVSAYQSPNRANNLRFTYLEDGVMVQRRDPQDKTDTWIAYVKLASYGKDAGVVALPKTPLTVLKHSVTSDNSEASVAYVNSKAGLRQTLLLKRRIEGRGPLRVQLNIITIGLNIFLNEQDRCLVFLEPHTGQEAFRYSLLHSSDASSKTLPARFEVSDSGGFSIAVDDEGSDFILTLSLYINWTTSGNQSDARFGFSVGSGGDLKVSTFGSLIIGAPYYDNGSQDEGMVFVYYGANDAFANRTSPDWTAEGNQAGARFGYSVSGDALLIYDSTYGCVIVGSPYFEYNNNAAAGAVYVWYGTPDGLGDPESPDWSGYGSQYYELYGKSVAGIKDVNGDSVDELAVGAPNYQYSGCHGRVLVYYGETDGSGLPASASVTLYDSADSEFGFSVSSARKTKGNSGENYYNDLVVGAPYWGDTNALQKGAAYVVYGSSYGLTMLGSTALYGANGYDQFGYSVSSALDFNADGYDDIVVGVPYYDKPGCYNEGRIYIFQGTSSGVNTSPFWYADSDQENALLGYSVSTAGIINDDDYDDIIAGAPYYDDDGYTDNGVAIIWTGRSSGTPAGTFGNKYWWRRGYSDDAHFGTSLCFLEYIWQAWDRWGIAIGGPEDYNGNGNVRVYVIQEQP